MMERELEERPARLPGPPYAATVARHAMDRMSARSSAAQEGEDLPRLAAGPARRCAVELQPAAAALSTILRCPFDRQPHAAFIRTVVRAWRTGSPKATGPRNGPCAGRAAFDQFERTVEKGKHDLAESLPQKIAVAAPQRRAGDHDRPPPSRSAASATVRSQGQRNSSVSPSPRRMRSTFGAVVKRPPRSMVHRASRPSARAISVFPVPETPITTMKSGFSIVSRVRAGGSAQASARGTAPAPGLPDQDRHRRHRAPYDILDRHLGHLRRCERQTPTGGVTRPSVRVITVMTRKCMGSTPSDTAGGNSTGIRMNMAAMASMNMPTG